MTATFDHTRTPGDAIEGASGQGSVRPGRRLVARLGIEVAIIAALMGGYNAVRLLIRGQEGLAVTNAEAVRSLESWLPLPSEEWLQDLVAGVPHIFETANNYYVLMHFPVMIAFLVFGFLGRSRVEYLWARNLAVLLTFGGLIVHVVYPLAPPRMFSEWGFLDTMSVIGPSPYDATSTVANQYAAMPSLHIGWALLIAFVVVRTGPRWIGVLAVLHAVATIGVVIITANHWWLDGIVAALILSVAVYLLPGPGRTRWTRADPSAQVASAGTVS